MEKNRYSSYLLIIVIYIIFIGLGLPDTILGVAWSSIRRSLSLPLEAAGIITLSITICTVISSFASGLLLDRFGTHSVIFTSLLFSSGALFGFSISSSLWWLLLFALPLGIGAGAIDTSVNHFVALNYSPKTMNWLHSFWGVGAFLGPTIISFYLANSGNWRDGYRAIAIILLTISLIVAISFSLWQDKSVKEKKAPPKETEKQTSQINLQLRRDIFICVIAFPIYIAIEMGIGVWMGSYLIDRRSLNEANAGLIVSLYYASITVGRIFSGFIANNIPVQKLLNLGFLLMFIGASMLLAHQNSLLITSILLLGIGCAPIYPSMIYRTPQLFGKANSQKITGYQIGCSYLSGVLILPAVGFLSIDAHPSNCKAIWTEIPDSSTLG